MRIAAFTLFITYYSILMVTPVRQAELRATTEAPTLFGKPTLLMEAMGEDDYRKKTAQLSKSSFFPSIKRKPPILSANARYGSGLIFAGLNRSWILDGDEEINFKSFMAEHAMTWPQIREDIGGPVQKLYRVESFPAYYLIGRDGTIVANSIKPRELSDEIEKHLGGQ